MKFLTFDIQMISNNSDTSVVMWLLDQSFIWVITADIVLWIPPKGFIHINSAGCQQEDLSCGIWRLGPI